MTNWLRAGSILLLFLFYGLSVNAQLKTARPGVWMTYYNGKDLKKDFTDMKNHGVDAVEVGIWGIEGNSRAKEVLKAARETGMELIIFNPVFQPFFLPPMFSNFTNRVGGK
jgi:hypothetical protein